ncbi:hypothetical protein HHI36_016481 [Cryptolaemus montrouzieri]|uniref:Uncharacterized protein n=1 Tax=Cryptolaemus montrouzieri TaxID=559131 RepID=A0ABD2NJU0_9CUCU
MSLLKIHENLASIIRNLADSLSWCDDEPYADSGSSYQPSKSGESRKVNRSEDSDGYITSDKSDQNVEVPVANLGGGNETWGPCGSVMKKMKASNTTLKISVTSIKFICSSLMMRYLN